MNYSDFQAIDVKDKIFNTQDKEFLSLLEQLADIDDPLHLQNRKNNVKVTSEGRIFGYFCSDIVFKLSQMVLNVTEIKDLEKGFDYAPIQKKTNEPERRKDFSVFFRLMRNK